MFVLVKSLRIGRSSGSWMYYTNNNAISNSNDINK